MKQNARRLLSFLLAVVMAFGLAGCGKEKEPSDPNRFVIGDCTLQYKGACLMTDSDGKDAVVLTLDFTNNSKEDAEYLWSVFEKAVQNGTDLEGAFIYVSEESYKMVTDDAFTDIAPGETIEVRSAYTLNDTTSQVEITFSDLLEKYKKTITIDPTTLTREEAQDSTGEDEISQQEGAESEQTNTTADDEYGKSSADATGIAKLEDMQALYKICFENRTDGYHVFTYEEARDMLGCDGIVSKKASFTWNDTKHTYRWETEDGKDFLSISFVLEDGE